jgi:hypothetical protein
MEGEPSGELPHRNGPAGEPHVSVQAIAGVVGESLVDLESAGLSHGQLRLGGRMIERAIRELSTVAIRIIGREEHMWSPKSK